MLEHIERFVKAGWVLDVALFGPATAVTTKVHARVWRTRGKNGHNYVGNSLDDALTGLNVYLFPKDASVDVLPSAQPQPAERSDG